MFCYYSVFFYQCKADQLGKCKRMPEQFVVSCTAALKNLISSDTIQSADDPYEAFSEGIQNFYKHYCLNDHSSSWCSHEKVQDLVDIISSYE